MGRPKINLPWRGATVLGSILRSLVDGKILDIVVVTGDAPVIGLPDGLYSAIRFANNPRSSQSGMIVTLQIGLSYLCQESTGAFVVLGDQPQIEAQVVDRLREAFKMSPAPILVPSYRMRRGHPWILGRTLWAEVSQMPSDSTLRDFLNLHSNIIQYLPVESESILQDIDTPEDYAKYLPG
jgi:molybdenum cofactor cytidylyltransferase